MLQVIPCPRRVQTAAGFFALDEGTRMVLSDPENEQLRRLGTLCADLIRDESGHDLSLAHEATATDCNSVTLRLVDGLAEGHEEGYRLAVTPRSMTLSSKRPAGIYYGLQTLRQILTRDGVPAVEIADAPRFS